MPDVKRYPLIIIGFIKLKINSVSQLFTVFNEVFEDDIIENNRFFKMGLAATL